MWRAISALILLAALPAGAADIGRGSLLTAEEAKPWRAVGRVNIAGMSRTRMCSGALIRPDVVLTAAHCLVHLNTGQLRLPGTIHFVAGWYRGKAIEHARARALVVHPDWQNSRRRPRLRTGTDLALIRLARPLDGALVRPFDVAPFTGRETFTMVGYRRDRAHAPTYQNDCRKTASVATRLYLACFAVKGASGSPIFVDGKDGPKIVAVLSAAQGGTTGQLITAIAYDAVQEMLQRLE